MLPAEGTSVPQNRIYRGTSIAPHVGTLDPSGYITRGIRQSRKRSGLAATALKMMQKPKPVAHPTINHPGIAKPTTTAVPHPATGTTQTISTSPTGRISLLPQEQTPPNNDPNSPSNVMPYDDGTALSLDALSKSRDDALNNLTNLRQQLSQRIGGQERSLDATAPQLALGLLNRYAGRGMARSSGYGYSVGQQNQQLADQKSSLEQQLREGLAGYDTQQQQANDAYNQGLAQLNFQSAGNLAKNAGNLGLGTVPSPTSGLTLQQLADLLAGKK